MEEKKKEKVGRKWFDITAEDIKNGKTEESVIAKIEGATAIDSSVKEVLYYADISKDSYYRYLEAHPLFRDRLSKLRAKPVLTARQEVIKGLNNNPEFSMKYLERKRRKEFSTQQNLNAEVEGDITIKWEK